MKFKLTAPFKPTGDQPQAISSLLSGLEHNLTHQVLLGVTGSGKTYTIANLIEKLNKPALVISHNKTLAAQLYQELRDFFPKNAVCYFVSYYDFYQPEAYIPQSDTYLEKETEINEEIDKLRLSATANLLSRRDTIVVASVSCIYNLGSPIVYGHFVLELKEGVKIEIIDIIRRLVDLQYKRSEYEFKRGNFRVRGDNIDIYPSYEDFAYRMQTSEGRILKIFKIDSITGDQISILKGITIYPAKHYMTNPQTRSQAFKNIKSDLNYRIAELIKQDKKLEAHRLNQRVNYDLEMIEEVGYVNGIENYSRYFDGRNPGEAPYTLLDYYKEKYDNDWLLFIDESHMTVPQIRGMFNGDRSRKQTLIDFGFRLPSALDNRPLKFSEFQRRISQTVYISATPDEWEISMAKEDARNHRSDGYQGIAEQLIRPTAIVDPEIIVKPIYGQINDLMREIMERKKRHERVLVTTLTKKTAEDLAAFIHDQNDIAVHYLHSDIKTLERSDILDDLRSGKYDVLVGINLLREGLDLPEVSLVAILDADKEGFLRSETSLIQTMGRAARHVQGTVIMYADKMTNSMKKAIDEIKRRRKIQLEHNINYRKIPSQINKPIRDKLVMPQNGENIHIYDLFDKRKKIEQQKLLELDVNILTPYDKNKYIKKLEKEMKSAAIILNFELAAVIRDKIKELKYAG